MSATTRSTPRPFPASSPSDTEAPERPAPRRCRRDDASAGPSCDCSPDERSRERNSGPLVGRTASHDDDGRSRRLRRAAAPKVWRSSSNHFLVIFLALTIDRLCALLPATAFSVGNVARSSSSIDRRRKRRRKIESNDRSIKRIAISPFPVTISPTPTPLKEHEEYDLHDVVEDVVDSYLTGLTYKDGATCDYALLTAAEDVVFADGSSAGGGRRRDEAAEAGRRLGGSTTMYLSGGIVSFNAPSGRGVPSQLEVNNLVRQAIDAGLLSALQSTPNNDVISDFSGIQNAEYVVPTPSPTDEPTLQPTRNPTTSPSAAPSNGPTPAPSRNPFGPPPTTPPTTSPTPSPMAEAFTIAASGASPGVDSDGNASASSSGMIGAMAAAAVAAVGLGSAFVLKKRRQSSSSSHGKDPYFVDEDGFSLSARSDDKGSELHAKDSMRILRLMDSSSAALGGLGAVTKLDAMTEAAAEGRNGAPSEDAFEEQASSGGSATLHDDASSVGSVSLMQSVRNMFAPGSAMRGRSPPASIPLGRSSPKELRNAESFEVDRTKMRFSIKKDMLYASYPENAAAEATAGGREPRNSRTKNTVLLPSHFTSADMGSPPPSPLRSSGRRKRSDPGEQQRQQRTAKSDFVNLEFEPDPTWDPNDCDDSEDSSDGPSIEGGFARTPLVRHGGGSAADRFVSYEMDFVEANADDEPQFV